MALKKALYYGVIAIAILIVVSVVVSIVSTILSLAWAIVSAAVSLAILAGLIYAAYKIGTWALGGSDDGSMAGKFGSSRASSSTDVSTDPQEKLRHDYVEGRISEAEFEERIGRELETESIDRELERER